MFQGDKRSYDLEICKFMKLEECYFEHVVDNQDKKGTVHKNESMCLNPVQIRLKFCNFSYCFFSL